MARSLRHGMRQLLRRVGWTPGPQPAGGMNVVSMDAQVAQLPPP